MFYLRDYIINETPQPKNIFLEAFYTFILIYHGMRLIMIESTQ